MSFVLAFFIIYWLFGDNKDFFFYLLLSFVLIAVLQTGPAKPTPATPPPAPPVATAPAVTTQPLEK